MNAHDSSDDQSTLRQLAEKRMGAGSRNLTDLDDVHLEDDGHLEDVVHELHVHRIELELQNEALQASYAELERARQHYLDLFDCAPTGYVILDELGAVVDINATCLHLLDRGRNALVGHAFGPLINARDRARYARFRRRLMQGEEAPPIEVRLMRGDGSFVPCLLIGQRQQDHTGTTPRLRFAIIDYTAQHALRISDEKIRAIVTYSTDGIVLTDADGRIIVWSPGQERITGLDRERAMGKYLWDVNFAQFPAHLQTREMYATLRNTLGGLLAQDPQDASMLTCEEVIVHPSGHVRTVQRAGFVIPFADGRMLGSIVRDVTGQKQTEADLQRRVAQLDLIYRASQAFISTLDLEEVLRLLLQEVIRLLDVSGASVWLADAKGEFAAHQWVSHNGECAIASNLDNYRPWVMRVVEDGQSLVISDMLESGRDARAIEASERSEMRACLLTPLKVKDHVIGVLHLIDRCPARFTMDDVTLLESLAAPAAIALDNARLFDEARAASELRERQRWVRRIHDLSNQSLFSASLIADVLPQLWTQDPAAGRRAAAELRTFLRQALAEQREAMLELQPAALVEADLDDALEQLADSFQGRTNIRVNLTFKGDGTLPARVRVALYRICQEALSNVARHASARHVTIALERDRDGATLRIADDGIGFDLDKHVAGRLGLQIMQDRADEVGAQWRITSATDQGTTIAVDWSMPLDALGVA